MAVTAVKFSLGLLFAAAPAVAQSTCTFTFDPAGPIEAPLAGGRVPGIRLLASAPDCPYQLRGPEWINIDYNQTGVGSSEFGLTIRENPSILPRTGVIAAGNSRLLVQQNGCVYTIQPPGLTASNAGASGALTLSGFISGNCGIGFVSQVPWLKFTQSPDNPRRFTFTVDPNPTGSPRAGEVWFGPAGNVEFYNRSLPNPPIFRVRQGDLLIPGSALVPAAGGLLDIYVNAPPGASWTAATQVPWLRIVSGLAGVGQGLVTVAIAPHSGAEPRSGEIFIAGLTFSLTQAVSSCRYAISPESSTAPAAGGTLAFNVGTECDWTASTGVSWITISTLSGRGEGQVRFTVAPNPRAAPRSATVTVAGSQFTVNQEANPCDFSVSPAAAEVDVVGGFGSFRVSGGTACSWTAATAEDWIDVRSSSGAGGEVTYVVLPNYSPETRTGRISIAGATFTISQAGRGPQISTAGLLNAASFLPGPVAPGEIVTIFGQGIGPAELVPLEVAPDGSVSKSLGGVRVLFDGMESPMIFASAGQLSAVVPYEVAGRSSTRVALEYQGTPSNVVAVPVTQASPAIFTANASGTGQGAVLNEDGTVNSSENPAAPGSVVVLYATGEGQTDPAGVNGRITGTDLPRPVLPIGVRIGDVEAEVLYGGSAPGLVSGVLQVNARIPASVSPGSSVPVLLRVGEFTSRPGVTIAVGP